MRQYKYEAAISERDKCFLKMLLYLWYSRRMYNISSWSHAKLRPMGTHIWEDYVSLDYETQLKQASPDGIIYLWWLL